MQIVLSTLAHIRLERLIAFLQWSLLGVIFILYIYYLVHSVMNVVLREELVVAIESAETRVEQLESAYLVRSADLTAELAKDMGLVESRPIAYVEVYPESGRLSRAE